MAFGFNITAPGEYQTADGRKVLVTTIFETQAQVAGLIDGEPCIWKQTGRSVFHDTERQHDLVCPWTGDTRQYYVIVFRDRIGVNFLTEEQARACGAQDVESVHHIVWHKTDPKKVTVNVLRGGKLFLWDQ